VLHLTVSASTLPISSAQAQPAERLTSSEPDASIPQIELVFGFDGVYGAGRFAPVTVLLTGGTEPFSGTVTLRYRQGGAQSIASVAAVAATPGRTVEVPLLLSPPPRLDALEVEVHNHLGRRVQTLNYRLGATMSGNDLPLPNAYSGATSLFVIVGDSPAIMSMNLALQRWHGQVRIQRTTVNVPPNSLPLHDSAYEGVHLLIVDEQAAREIEPARAAAIRQWVASGGRVLVLTGRSGSAWRTFLPGPAANAIEVGDTITLAGLADLDAELEELATRRVFGERPNVPPSRWPPVTDESETTAQELRIRPAATVLARPIRLLDIGEAMGWKTRWIATDSADQHTRPAALLAEGPAGLGWAVVLGTEPRFLPDPVNTQSELLVLRAAISNILADFDALQQEARSHGWFSGPIPMSVESMTSQSAQSQGFQVLLEGIESPTWAILFVGIAMVLLALLVGPVDFLVLRRIGLSHRSWLTALGWITIASLIAYMLPNVTDRGTTRLAQLHTVDMIAAPAEGASAPVPPIAWRTSLVGLYSATRDLLTIVESADVAARTSEQGGTESAAAARRIAPPGGVWRGVAPTQTYWHQSQPTGVRLPMVQSAPPPQAAVRDVAWRGLAPGNATATGGQSLQPVNVGPWTLRTLEGHRRDQPNIRAAAEFSESTTTNKPTLRVVLEGLPPGSAIEHSSCSIGGRRVDLPTADRVDSNGRVALLSQPIDAAALQPDRFNIIGPVHHGGLRGGNWQNFGLERVPEYLPGSERRTLAFEHLAQTGRWIVVRCTLANDDAGSLTLVRRNGEVLPHEVIERTVYRIAVPLDDAAAAVVERLLAGAPDLPASRTTGTRR